eukprot:scaffold3818_cov327-Pinguiococcus_pyrenoidosus.AAC.2
MDMKETKSARRRLSVPLRCLFVPGTRILKRAGSFPDFVRCAAEAFQAQDNVLDSTDRLVHSVTASVIELSDIVIKLKTSTFNPAYIDLGDAIAILDGLLKEVITWTGFPEWQRRTGWSRTGKCILAYKFGLRVQRELLRLAEFEQKLPLAIVGMDSMLSQDLMSMVMEATTNVNTKTEDILKELRPIQEGLAKYFTDCPEALSGITLAEGDVVDFGSLLRTPHALATVMYKDIYRHQLMMPLRRRAPARRHILKIPTQLVGRDAALADIGGRLEAPGTLICIYGPAGVGKSSLAEHAARAFLLQDVERRYVWTLASETEDALKQSYLEILSSLNVTINVADCLTTQSIAERVSDVLSAIYLHWLLIFDNAPEEGEAFLEGCVFPSGSGLDKGRLLITRRSMLGTGDTLRDGARVYPVLLQPLSVDDGAMLLRMDHAESSDEEVRASKT